MSKRKTKTNGASAELVEEARITEFDFEEGDLEGWLKIGSPNATSLRIESVAAAAKWTYNSVGWQGRRFLASGAGRHDFNGPLTLLSPRFTLHMPYLRFLLAAELHPEVRVGLVCEGEEVRTAYGNNAYDATLRGWDVSHLVGRSVQLLVRDVHPWRSLLRLDDVHQSAEPPPELGSFEIERRTESTLARAGEFRLIMDARELDERQPCAVEHSCIVKGHDGRWHLYGCYAGATDEFLFGSKTSRLFHASADSLRQSSWDVEAAVFRADERFGETHLRFPHVTFYNGTYYLFYLGRSGIFNGFNRLPGIGEQAMFKGRYGDVGPQEMFLATSSNGIDWERHPSNPIFGENAFLYGARIARIDERWICYYQATDNGKACGKHCLAYRTSDDLLVWSDPELLFIPRKALSGYSKDPSVNNPFLWHRNGLWHLFTGWIDSKGVPSRFHMSRIYTSKDPLRWDPDLEDHGHLYVDGGSSIVTEDGVDYITTCNMTTGGVWLAPLHWNDSGS